MDIERNLKISLKNYKKINSNFPNLNQLTRNVVKIQDKNYIVLVKKLNVEEDIVFAFKTETIVVKIVFALIVKIHQILLIKQLEYLNHLQNQLID